MQHLCSKPVLRPQPRQPPGTLARGDFSRPTVCCPAQHQGQPGVANIRYNGTSPVRTPAPCASSTSATSNSTIASGDLAGWVTDVLPGSGSGGDIHSLLAEHLGGAGQMGTVPLLASDDLDLDFSLGEVAGPSQVEDRRSSSAHATTSAPHHMRPTGRAAPGSTRRAPARHGQAREANAQQQPYAERHLRYGLTRSSVSAQQRHAGACNSQPASQSARSASYAHASKQSTSQGSSSSGQIDDRALTRELSRAASLPQLQMLCEQHQHRFNHLHAACALNRLAKVSGNRGGQQAHALLSQLEPLFVAHLPQLSAREVANGLWAWAKLGRPIDSPPVATVLAALCEQDGILLKGSKATPQALSSAAWALCTLRCEDERVWGVLTAAMRTSLQKHKQLLPAQQHQRQGGRQEAEQQWQPVDIAQAAWSLASAGRHDVLLFHDLSASAMGRLPEFTPQDLSNLLWALATARHAFRPLFEAAAPVACSLVTGFTPQGLSNLLWAFTTAGCTDLQLIAAITQQASRRVGDLQPCHLAQLCWAMARSGQVNSHLMQAAGAAAMSDPDAWKTKELAVVLWAYGTSQLPDERVFGVLGTILIERMGGSMLAPTQPPAPAPPEDSCHPGQPEQGQQGRPRAPFVAHDVANAVWAHAKAGVYSPRFFNAAAELCLTHRARWVSSPQAFQSTLWSFGYAGHYHARLFDAAAEGLIAAVGEGRLRPDHVAGLLLPMAQMQHRNDAVCAAAAGFMRRALESSPSSLSLHTVASTLWSLAVLDYCDPHLLHTAFKWMAAMWGRHQGTGHSDKDGSSAYAPQAVGQARTLQHAAGSGMPTKQLCQVFQTYMWLQGRVSASAGAASGPKAAVVKQSTPHSMSKEHVKAVRAACAQLPADLLSAASSAWREQAEGVVAVSPFQAELHAAVMAMGLGPRMECKTRDRLFSMDMVVTVGGVQVAVEANGPAHYTATRPRRLLGNKVLRDRLLAVRGYRVLNVPWWRWQAASAHGEAVVRAYLVEEMAGLVGEGVRPELSRLQKERVAADEASERHGYTRAQLRALVWADDQAAAAEPL